MKRRINQRELRNDSSRILHEVERGASFEVTRNGTPVGDLVPHRRKRSRPREEIMRAARQLGRIDYQRFRTDLDAVADPAPVDRYAERDKRQGGTRG